MALADVLAAAIVRPALVGFLDFASDPVRGWTGPGTFAPSGTGDPDLDGDTFTSTGGALHITAFAQDQGLGGPVTVTFAAGEMDDEEIVQQIVADRRAYLGRRARFWLFFLNEAESAALPEFDSLFTGVMVHAETNRQPGQPATIAVTCDQDTQKAYNAPVRWADHQRFYPDDTASTFINDLVRGTIAGAGDVAPRRPRLLPSADPSPAPRPRAPNPRLPGSQPPPSTPNPRTHPALRP
jgi:hypothetical protein